MEITLPIARPLVVVCGLLAVDLLIGDVEALQDVACLVVVGLQDGKQDVNRLDCIGLHQACFELAETHDAVGLRVEIHVGRGGGDEHLMLTGCHFELTLELRHPFWQVICQELTGFVVSMSDDAEQEM